MKPIKSSFGDCTKSYAKPMDVPSRPSCSRPAGQRIRRSLGKTIRDVSTALLCLVSVCLASEANAADGDTPVPVNISFTYLTGSDPSYEMTVNGITAVGFWDFDVSLLPGVRYRCTERYIVGADFWVTTPACYTVRAYEIPGGSPYGSLINDYGNGFFHYFDLGAGAFELEVVPRVELESPVYAVQGARTLKADGEDRLTLTLAVGGFATPPITWTIQGDKLGCEFISDGVLRSGKEEGSVTVRGTDALGCYGEIGRAHV